MTEQNSSTGTQQQATAAQLRSMIMGFRTTQLIAVAATLGLADQLRHGARPVDALAQAVGAEPQALHRLLRALAGMGVFAATGDGAFELTPLAAPLLSTTPGSLRSLAMLYGADWLWQAYGQLLHSVRTGRPAFDHAHGQPFYTYLEQHDDAAAIFDAAMSGYSSQEAAALLSAYDWSGLRSVVDVGGGQGAWLAALLEANPDMHGVVFDRAPVVVEAAELLSRAGLDARCSCVAGDFFAAVPAGGDAYVLKSVLHNWDDTASTTILRHCRAAAGDAGRVLIIERIIPPGNEPAEAKLFDINMLVVTGGRERTAAEYGALLAAVGFTLMQIVPTATALSIVEGAALPQS